MNVTTVAARSAAALVAAVAGAASYSHIADVAIGAGERSWVGYALPLAVDGLILVGVSALFEDKRAGRAGRLSARVAVGVGVLATLAANVASAEPHLQARLVAVTAPVAFLIAVEVLTRRGRVSATVDAFTEMPSASVEAVAEELATVPPGIPRRRASRRAPNAERVAKARSRTPGATPAEVAARLKISTRTVERYWDAPTPDKVPTANGHLPAETAA